ncbi:hypothetical protein ACLOJK_025335 [Asimina triloba]
MPLLMDSSTSCSVIIVGAGISGISAAKVLAENGVEDLVILEASDRIGGRIRTEDFGGLKVEIGAGWIQGVGGRESNPVWELACKTGLRTCYSDYSNARYNIYDRRYLSLSNSVSMKCRFGFFGIRIRFGRWMLSAHVSASAGLFNCCAIEFVDVSVASFENLAFYGFVHASARGGVWLTCALSTWIRLPAVTIEFPDISRELQNVPGGATALIRCLIFAFSSRSGKIFPSRVAAESYERAVESAIRALRNQKAKSTGVSALVEPPLVPSTPIELAIDFILHDFEMAEVEPIATYTDLGDREFLVADDRGYEFLLYKMAESFLSVKDGNIVDPRLKLNEVVREVHYSRNGATLVTEDGGVFKARYVILTASVGVLQGDLIQFSPPLPKWKTEAILKLDVIVYTKIFLKFPYKFWPCGPGTEFFLYAHEKRGYYTFWQARQESFVDGGSGTLARLDSRQLSFVLADVRFRALLLALAFCIADNVDINCTQHMENAYPDSNMLVVTLTNEESKRVESQSEEETMKEVMQVVRDMFGPDVPDVMDIFVPKWWNNRFQRGSYSNYPIFSTHDDFHDLKAPVGPIFFSGEHTSERFNGYVHGGYLSAMNVGAWALSLTPFYAIFAQMGGFDSIDTSNALLEAMKKDKERSRSARLKNPFLLQPLLALTESLSLTQQDAVSRLQKWDVARRFFINGKLVIQEAIK